MRTESDFERFFNASQTVETWLVEIGHRFGQDLSGHQATLEEMLAILLAIDDQHFEFEGIFFDWESDIIICDPAGSSASVGFEGCSTQATSHTCATTFLVNIKYAFLSFIGKDRGVDRDDEIDAEKFAAWIARQERIATSGFVRQICRERAYVQDRFGPPDEEYSNPFPVKWWENELPESESSFLRKRNKGTFHWKKVGGAVAIRMKDLESYPDALKDKVRRK